MFQTECTACGLSVHDLPDDLGDLEAVRDQFFECPHEDPMCWRDCQIYHVGQGRWAS